MIFYILSYLIPINYLIEQTFTKNNALLTNQHNQSHLATEKKIVWFEMQITSWLSKETLSSRIPYSLSFIENWTCESRARIFHCLVVGHQKMEITFDGKSSSIIETSQFPIFSTILLKNNYKSIRCNSRIHLFQMQECLCWDGSKWEFIRLDVESTWLDMNTSTSRRCL